MSTQWEVDKEYMTELIHKACPLCRDGLQAVCVQGEWFHTSSGRRYDCRAGLLHEEVQLNG